MISRHPNGTITATSARRIAKALGPDHPAVVKWRNVAAHRVSKVNNADKSHRKIVAPGSSSLESAIESMAEALSYTPTS